MEKGKAGTEVPAFPFAVRVPGLHYQDFSGS